MVNKFAGSEIIDIGTQIEKNGFEFYRTLSRKTEHDGVRMIFEYLADEEQKHIAMFKLLSESCEKSPEEVNFPDEYAQYMNALALEHVFPSKEKAEELIVSIKSDIDAINIAIQFEKDSIVFFESMKKMVRKDDTDAITALVAEEQKHLEKLYAMKKELS